MIRYGALKPLVMIFFLLATTGIIDLRLSLAYENEIKGLSAEMAEDISRAGNKTVAVADFPDLQGNITELGRFIAEEFSIALAGAGKGFEVVERTHLRVLLKEHKLSLTGLIDPETAKKLGEIAGVDALVVGTITPFGDSVRISAKILDTSTAKVVGASSCNIAKTKAVEELLVTAVETPTPGQSTTRSRPLTPKTKSKTPTGVVVNKVKFEVRECRISNGTLICDLVITNNDHDKIVKLCGYRRNTHEKSVATDNFNVAKSASAVEIPEKKLKHKEYVSVALVHDESVTVQFSFYGLTPEVTSLTMLTIKGSDSRVGNFTAVLKNIPVIR